MLIQMASSAASKPRVRASHTKSRRACITCRARRIRCDETKPSCKNCEKAGKTCEGYQVQFKEAVVKSAQNLEVVLDPRVDATLRGPSLREALPDAEMQVLDYFTNRTLPLLRDYYPSDLWDRTLPYFMEQEGVFRRCAMAIGSWHQWHSQLDNAGIDEQREQLMMAPYGDQFSFEQYSKAIQLLRTQLQSETPDISSVLLSCLLFVTLESLLGRPHEMSMHFHNGIQLIKNAPRSHITRQGAEILFTFARFGLLSALCVGPSEPALGEFLDLKFLLDKVHGLNRLRAEIQIISVELSELGRRSRRGLLSLQEALSKRNDIFKRLSTLYEQLDSYHLQASSSSESSQCSLLKAEWELTHLVAGIDISLSQRYYDQHMDVFERIIAHVSCALQLAGAFSGMRPSFSVDTGILAILYYSAALCRHPALRRQAIDLMAFCPRHEGLWDAEEAAEAARIIVRFEEEGLEGEDYDKIPNLIPEHRRAHHRYITKKCPDNNFTSSVQLLLRPAESLVGFVAKDFVIQTQKPSS